MSSNQEIQNIISPHTNAELFEKKRYAWTGTTSLGQYLILPISSHYDWAFKINSLERISEEKKGESNLIV